MNIVNFKQENYFYKNLFKKENEREINIYKYSDCIFTGIDLYYPNILLHDGINYVNPIIEKTMSLNMSSIYEINNMNFNLKIKKNNFFYEEPLFFFIYNTDNYFHFLYDTIPYLISYIHLKKIVPSIKLLIQYPNCNKKSLYPFIIEYLELLDIRDTDLVIVNDNTVYKSIYISTSYTHDINSNLPPRKEIFKLYQNMAKIVKNKYNIGKTPEKIYISRRTWIHNNLSNIGTNYTTRRKMINEDELVDKLKNKGYEEVFTENLTTIEKILYFANATHVIGAIGGGISNVLFSPKTTKLEAIVSPTFLDVNYRFKYSLNCVDVTYNYNTAHVENDEFKTYMRVKTKDNIFIGEIEKIENNKLTILYTDKFNVGWNLNNQYNKIELDKNEVIKLDNGLNSPWKLLCY